MQNSTTTEEIRCPSCGSFDTSDWVQLRPYCSDVCRLLWRYGLAWQTNPYQIVVRSHPHLVVQTGPNFDLREPALRHARERVLATERQRKHRATARVEMSRIVTPAEQFNTLIQGPSLISGVENAAPL